MCCYYNKKPGVSYSTPMTDRRDNGKISTINSMAMPTFAHNTRAKFDYDIKDTFTAGMVLTGPEVKSVKGGNVSLAGSYVTVRAGEVNLLNAHIGPTNTRPAKATTQPTPAASCLTNTKLRSL